MKNQSKVFFSIFWILGKSQVTSLLVRVSYSLPYIRNFSFIFHHIPNCEHSSLFTLHSSLFILHHIPKLIRLASLFILHSSFFTLKNYPTLPSKLISKSFWASTANSIGSLLSTSFPKPFTMSEIAFSVSIPR